jgi:hypothetical protein
LRLGGKSNDGRSEWAAGHRPNQLGRILILSLACWYLAIIAAVWWYYTVQKRETEGAALRAIFAVSAGKTSQVANWRRERIGDGHVVMSSAVMRTARRVLSSRTVADRDRTDLLDLMRRLAGAFLYTDAALVDLDGNVRVRLHEDDADSPQFGNDSRRTFARQADTASDVILSDLTAETRTKAPLMSLTVPVTHLGAFILDIDPSRFLYPYMEAWPGSSRTGESLLVRLEGEDAVYLNRRRRGLGLGPLSRRRPGLSLPPEEALDAGWSVAGLDYRGVPVMATVRRIPDSPWFMVCKMDLAEVHAPLVQLGRQMMLITALIGLATAAGGGLIWRGQQARLHREREVWFLAVANDTPAYL